MKESPFASLETWLSLAAEPWAPMVRDPDDPEDSFGLDAWAVPGLLLDLRHGPTRYAVLRALHDVGIDRPWALGAPWSPLTDEQAGRATAAILRAVGSDPSKPKGVVPDRILSEWLTPSEDGVGPRHYRFGPAVTWREVEIGSVDGGRYVVVCQEAWIADLPWNGETPYIGPETGEPGRIAADNAARALGCIMIEDITP